MKKSEKDNIQFRILYFIGIVLIVASHCGGGSISLVYEWFPAYSFHNALFVFASGYFFVKNKNKSILEFIKKICIKFLVPLYAWNLIYGLIIFILHQFGFKFGTDLSFNSMFVLPIFNGHQFAFNLASWFIFPLFVIQVLNIFFVKLIDKKYRCYYLHFIISLILGFVGTTLAIKGYNKGFFLLLDRVLYFIPFFSLGILYKTNLEKYDTSSNLIYFSINFMLSLIIIYIFGGIKSYTPSWCNNFDNFYRPFIVGGLGIAFWLRISRIFVPALKDSKIVNVISKNTFSIMMHHLMGFFVLNTLWAILANTFSFIEGFNFEIYKASIWYKYLPKGLIHFRMLYLVFGIVVSLLIAYLAKEFVLFVKNKMHVKSEEIY